MEEGAQRECGTGWFARQPPRSSPRPGSHIAVCTGRGLLVRRPAPLRQPPEESYQHLGRAHALRPKLGRKKRLHWQATLGPTSSFLLKVQGSHPFPHPTPPTTPTHHLLQGHIKLDRKERSLSLHVQMNSKGAGGGRGGGTGEVRDLKQASWYPAPALASLGLLHVAVRLVP